MHHSSFVTKIGLLAVMGVWGILPDYRILC